MDLRYIMVKCTKGEVVNVENKKIYQHFSESSGDSCVFVNRKPMKICSCRFPIGNNQRHISELKHGLVDFISIISEISKMSEMSEMSEIS